MDFGNPQIQSFVMIGGMVLIFYFMLIRPQKQQKKKRDDMLNALAVGDKILTGGGIFGEIMEIRDKSIRVKVAKGVILRMTRAGVQSKTSGTQED